MRRLLGLTAVFVIALLAFNAGGGWAFNYLTTIAESHSGHQTVVVRRLQTKRTPIAYLLNTSPIYRCELYVKGTSTLESACMYRGESLYANKAKVEWTARGEAVVSIDGEPVVFCDQRKFWRPIQERSPDHRLKATTR